MKQKLVDRVAFRLVLWLVSFSIILTILGTAGQLYFDYTDELKQVGGSVETAVLQQLPDVYRSVLAGDSSSVDNILFNLVKNSGLAYAAVIVDKKVAWQQGTKLAGSHIRSSFPLTTVEGAKHQSGSLEVMADIKPLWRQLIQRFCKMLLINGIKIFCLAGFVFLLCQCLVTRHLEFLAQQTRHLDFTKPYRPFTLDRTARHRPDEFDQLLSGLNTIRQKAREAYDSLARNEQRLVLFFDSTEEAIIGVDRDGLCSFANDACLRLLCLHGYETIIGKTLSELFVHSRGRDFTVAQDGCIILQSMAKGQALECEDGSLVDSSGRTLLVSLRSYPVFKDGLVSGAVVFINDNSEQRQLRRERELLSEAVKQAPLMIVITDKDDIIQYANPGTEQMTGLSGDELVGLSIAQVDELTILPEIRLSEIKAMLKQGKQWAGVIEIRSKWGTRLKLYSVVSPIFDEQKRVVNTISVSREVSYEIALQNELVNAKKMEALGRLSASFAHEFGNPLFGVHSVLRDMSDRLELSPEDKQLLSLAFRECQRMRTMVREFQQLYRDSAGGMEKQGLEVIIAEVLEETKAKLLSVNVELAVKIDPKTKEFAANKDKVFLVLHNIVVNAIESMAKRGGRLDIACYLEEKHIVVLVSDTGVGIKKEHKELIFEPFFSTKPVVEGAGLGLSVAYGTMKNLGGTISFISEEGKGTSFKVHLPIS